MLFRRSVFSSTVARLAVVFFSRSFSASSSRELEVKIHSTTVISGTMISQKYVLMPIVSPRDTVWYTMKKP
ncbi:hypothetical protein D3C75_1171750 [compost metagenome]